MSRLRCTARLGNAEPPRGVCLYAGALCAALFLCIVAARATAQDAAPPPEVVAALTPSLPASLVRKRLTQAPATKPPSGPRRQDKIIGGKDARPDQFPWQVALLDSLTATDRPFTGFYCGGTLIGWKWVLTAAHCTFEDNPEGRSLASVPKRADSIDVYVGSHNFAGGERIKVRRIVRHDYNLQTLDNDIALIELATEPARKGKLKLVRLLAPDDTAPVDVGRRVTAIGWGSTEQGIVADRVASRALQYVDSIEIKASAKCNAFYVADIRTRAGARLKALGKSDADIKTSLNAWYPLDMQKISGNMICAGTDIGAADTCFGDSGGPLLVERGGDYAQAGIVSWGPNGGCGLANLYGVYVQVPRYLDWIAKTIK
jgi:secreted trypsin-like serine protease